MSGLQNVPWNKVGSLSERPTASKTQEGYLFFDRDAGAGYVLSIHPTTKVRSWVQFSAGATGLSSKYWVNLPGSIPVVGYTTIQSAIDAAVADGASAAKPATIMIYAGAYAEALTVPEGVSLMGFGDPQALTGFGAIDGVVILGDVHISGVTGGNAFVSVTIIGSVYVQSAIAQPIVVVFNNATVLGQTDHAITLNATGVNIIGINSQISGANGKVGIRCDGAGSGCKGTFTGCGIKGSGGGANGCALQLVDGGWTFTRCYIEVSGAANQLIRSFSDVHVVNIECRNCILRSTDGNAATTSVLNDSGAGSLSLIGAGCAVTGFPAGVVLNGGVGGSNTRVQGCPNVGKYTLANSPASPHFQSLDGQGARCFISNGCQPTEATGGGTGTYANWDDISSKWVQPAAFCAGTAQIAGASATVAVNDARITANTPAQATLQAADGTLLYVQYIVLGAGSMTIHGNAAATGATNVSWHVDGKNMPVIA